MSTDFKKSCNSVRIDCRAKSSSGKHAGRVRIFLVLTLSAASALAYEAAASFQWILPAGFHPPPVPADNPMLPAKVELGRYLFYDLRMSANGRGSCSTCASPKLRSAA